MTVDVTPGGLAYIRFRPGAIERTELVGGDDSDVAADLAADGTLLGLELTDLSDETLAQAAAFAQSRGENLTLDELLRARNRPLDTRFEARTRKEKSARDAIRGESERVRMPEKT